ncbi:MAG TPA: glycosyltransferase [Candidatus Sulfotelmatobacter sp.]|nr:glycosyltransferase [Candidatus Sulfotelmatobacter sp.]
MSHIWGIVPAAGLGTRIQPLAFSKELLPVGSRVDNDQERPRAVSEYLIERMLAAGSTRICFVVSPGKTDIMQYFGGRLESAAICYAVQQDAQGLCDALFTALAFIGPADEVLIGLPDTIWFPVDGFQQLPAKRFSFLLFPVRRPNLFDAVRCDDQGFVKEVQVKVPNPGTNWVWGAFRLTVFRPGEDFLSVPDGRAMKAEIARLVEDDQAREQLSRNALETIRRHHTCLHRARQFEEICEELGK